MTHKREPYGPLPVLDFLNTRDDRRFYTARRVVAVQ